MKWPFLSFALIFSLNSFAEFHTSCQLKDGKGHGFVHNQGSSFEIDGYVWFFFFDKDGDLIDKEDEYEYEYVSSRSTEEIEQTNAPSKATTCSFDVSTAVVGNPSPNPKNYIEICTLNSGKAYGSVRNLEQAFTINGYVWFYFYDKDGDFIDKEDEFEYEYVSSRSTEDIDYTNAPRNAHSCTFDISGAIEK